jgi:hypothetical protein
MSAEMSSLEAAVNSAIARISDLERELRDERIKHAAKIDELLRLPRSDSSEAYAMIQTLLAEHEWLRLPQNAERAGWMAAARWLQQRRP